MENLRYEEHLTDNSTVPFILLIDIKRDSENISEQANWHENIEIQAITSGKGFVLFDGEYLSVKAGDIVVANSKVIHYTGTDSRLTYTCLIVDSAFCLECGFDVNKLHVKSKIFDKNLFEKIMRLSELCLKDNGLSRKLKLTAKLLEILASLADNYLQDFEVETNQNKYYQAIKNCIKFIRENYAEKITLEALSKVAFIDKFTLSKEFKKLTNHTVIDYINSYRIKRAIEFLAKGYSVNETANKVGFFNMSFFTKMFKEYTGNLPSKYRR